MNLWPVKSSRLAAKRSFKIPAYNGGSLEDESYNSTSWEILWSSSGDQFKPLDYQKDCKENVATFETGEVTCRYIMLKIYTPDSGTGTVRLYELCAG